MNTTRIMLIVATLLTAGSVEAGSVVGKDCTWNGIRLAGKVQIVDQKRHPNIRIKVVEHFSDMKVKMVENFPDRCGEWKIVDRNPDFTVAFVTSNHFDFKVKWENHFPGVSR